MTDINDIRQLADRIAATPEPLTEDLVAEITGLRLAEIPITNPYFREFEGVSTEGPFTEVSFRRRAEPDSGPHVTILNLRPTQTPQLTSDDFWDAFNFGNARLDVNPDIPPEGRTSYILPLGDRKLRLAFMGISKVFVGFAVHEG